MFHFGGRSRYEYRKKERKSHVQDPSRQNITKIYYIKSGAVHKNMKFYIQKYLINTYRVVHLTRSAPPPNLNKSQALRKVYGGPVQID